MQATRPPSRTDSSRGEPAATVNKKQKRPAEAGRFELHQTKRARFALEGQRREGQGRIASCRRSRRISRLRADRILECCTPYCTSAPTGSYGLAHSKDSRVAAFLHRDETFDTIRNGSIHYGSVIDVIFSSGKNRSRRVRVFGGPNFQGSGCPGRGA